MYKGQPLDHRHADVVGEFKRGSARAAFGAVDDDKVRHDPRVQHRLDHTHEFTLVADAQLEPHRLAARQIAQLAQKLHHLHRRGERRMGCGRDAVVPHRDAPCRRDLSTDLRRGQHATMTGFGTLAQLKLDHLDLVACGLLLEFVGVELPVFCATAKIARPDFIDQIAAPLAVIAADPAFAGVMGELAHLGPLVQGADRIGRQRPKAHRRDIVDRRVIGLLAVLVADGHAKIRVGDMDRLDRMGDP